MSVDLTERLTSGFTEQPAELRRSLGRAFRSGRPECHGRLAVKTFFAGFLVALCGHPAES